ncbi:MAG: sugar nucleotide-binding protein [Ilumatobacter sp.]
MLTGASGFVGSNIAKVLTDRHGDQVIGDRVDIVDRDAVLRHVHATRPDAIVHCAILNDWHLMMADRVLAWNAYVEATRHHADGAARLRGSGSPTTPRSRQLPRRPHSVLPCPYFASSSSSSESSVRPGPSPLSDGHRKHTETGRSSGPRSVSPRRCRLAEE